MTKVLSQLSIRRSTRSGDSRITTDPKTRVYNRWQTGSAAPRLHTLVLKGSLRNNCTEYILYTMHTTHEEFRAAELLARTSIPRTTLHYYLREGLIPPPRKPTPNSALYSGVHVDRIDLLRRLRSPEYGALSTSRIRRVLDRMDKGVSLDVAVEMEGLMGISLRDSDDRWSLTDLAEHHDVPVGAVKQMVRIGLLMPDPLGRAGGFTALEGALAQALHQVTQETPLSLEDLGPIADTIRNLARIEMALRDRVVMGTARGDENAMATLGLQRVAELLHPYLISRSMESEIANRKHRVRLMETS